MEAYEKLSAEGISARVVSMPSWDIFEAQGIGLIATVLPPEISRERVAVEASAGARLGSLCPAHLAKSLPCAASALPRPSTTVEIKFGFTVRACVRRGETTTRCTPRIEKANPMTNPLLQLGDQGQSVWLDYLHQKIPSKGRRIEAPG